MRLADRASLRWYLAATLLLGTTATLLRCHPPKQRMWTCGTTAGLMTVHVKLKPHVYLAYKTAQPLFHHLPAGISSDDPRTRWMQIQLPVGEAADFIEHVEDAGLADEAFIPPQYSLPTEAPYSGLTARDDGAACPINTPSFESYQGYLGAAPQGIDAPAAWRRGIRGGGVWFADIEGNWNASHEDLPGDRITHAGGALIQDQHWRAHGTAVLGEVVGRDNGKGVVGIAPDVERVFTASIGDMSVADAIDTAAEQLRAGDVLLIELQGGGPRGRYLPVEWWDDNYDAIRAATARGVVVIEAAGNGAENLDHKAYKGKLTRGSRDSGAIMVGAGGPAREGFVDRKRLDFSNFGTRVDVQGWGRRVATLDYGDLQSCSNTDERWYTHRHYTDEFSGTSSASPIVAGAAVLLESYAKSRGKTLAPAQVRKILAETGTPQVETAAEPIGPRPDLARALRALE